MPGKKKPETNEQALAKRKGKKQPKGQLPAESVFLYPTPLQVKVLEGIISQGNHFITACKAAGVSWDQFQGWRERGGRGDPNLREFVEAIDKAEAAAEQRALAIVLECAAQAHVTTTKKGVDKDGNPVDETIVSDNPDRYRAAAWLLEHRFGERFSRMRRLQQSGILTHRQVIVMHDDDPSLELEVWPEDGDGPAQVQATDATYALQEPTEDAEAGADE